MIQLLKSGNDEWSVSVLSSNSREPLLGDKGGSCLQNWMNFRTKSKRPFSYDDKEKQGV